MEDEKEKSNVEKHREYVKHVGECNKRQEEEAKEKDEKYWDLYWELKQKGIDIDE